MTTPIPATPFTDPAPAQRLERAAAALTAHGFAVEILDDDAARTRIKDLIPEGASVFTAASETLRLAGIEDDINTSGRYQAIKPRTRAMGPAATQAEDTSGGSARTLVIGRSPEVNRSVVEPLLDAGIDAHGSTQPEQASRRFDARQFDLIAFGRGVPGPLSDRLKREFTAQNPGIRFVDVFAPVAVKQILAALARDRLSPKFIRSAATIPSPDKDTTAADQRRRRWPRPEPHPGSAANQPGP